MTSKTANVRAVEIVAPGGPEQLQPTEVSVPAPAATEVQIAVQYAGVNRPDCLQRLGRYAVPADASPLPGLEVAGTVVAVGEAVTDIALGDPRCALVHGGGYAEICNADAGHTLPVPASYDMREAAALPETLFTVYYNLLMRCRLRQGESLLVHGGSSGIGSTAIQLAKALGVTVATTAGSDEKCRFAAELGADLVINYRNADFVDEIRNELGGVDVVLDMVGGDYTQRNLDLLKQDGRYALIAFLRGPKTAVNLTPILRRRLTVTGSTLRPQSTAEKAAIAAGIFRDVWPAIESGLIRPSIYAEFPLDNAAAAHTLMESGVHMGKIVLAVT
ncbi:MAG: NAD(P)H-quinone oxidoreductase [Pseudomonadota bacterium]